MIVSFSLVTRYLVLSPGFCRRNVTCDCGPNTKVSRRVREDRNFALFSRNLQDALIYKLFSKKEDDSGKNESSSEKGTKKTGPVCDEEAIKKVIFLFLSGFFQHLVFLSSIGG